MQSIRGGDIAMIFQEPMTSFSPVHTIGNQIMETIMLHRQIRKEEARSIALKLLNDVGIPSPENAIDEYTFNLSGGMRQRAMIAMALSCQPRLLIADEPTTAVDVTIQAQVLELMKQVQSDYHMALIVITHDTAVIAEMADHVLIMYLGKGVEYGTVDEIFYEPKHPYTAALMDSVLKLEFDDGPTRKAGYSRIRTESVRDTGGMSLSSPLLATYRGSVRTRGSAPGTGQRESLRALSSLPLKRA